MQDLTEAQERELVRFIHCPECRRATLDAINARFPRETNMQTIKRLWDGIVFVLSGSWFWHHPRPR